MRMGERDSAAIAEEEEEEAGDLEPFFYDEAAAVAEAAAAAERRRLQEEEEAREKEARAGRLAAHNAVMELITETDPETNIVFYNRYHEEDFSQFDIDEVSPLPPMRFTATDYRPGEAKMYTTNMVNVLAVRIVPDDGDAVPFPIAVYGSLIVRDDLDRKCLPLFRRSRDDPQLIASKDDSLILTGPQRGLVLEDALYFEFDLKLKGDQVGGEDRQLSKGLLWFNGVYIETNLLLEQKLLTAVRGVTLDRCRRLNRLYPVQVMYAFVSDAVEATVSVQVLQGHFFYGKITACTSRVKDSILLYDSSLVAGGAAMAAHQGNDHFASVRLLRPVMAVCLHEMLIISILAQVDVTKYTRRTIHFKPAVNGGHETQITCGVNSLLVKVNWSLMYPAGK
ncbi:uncharacterized protein LOC102721042 [Oryza brachyantha]|uniref:DUF6598 domain-containing protein n=1 Tax=Oryza brachyantha TaxID=4533 RepID=J3NF42_ORYBR|nr:uncharacterized protein LOC102721042 [Oryza brachyantha]